MGENIGWREAEMSGKTKQTKTIRNGDSPGYIKKINDKRRKIMEENLTLRETE